uniref:Peptidase S59 domain-containing protein n=1 Tax=Kalanchoe fedtschenkoi TaxID=63787 RepID=A0A7N0ZRH1_KALFE
MAMGYQHLLPTSNSSDYYFIPSLEELATMETLQPGYCTRVPHFTVGRFGYGHVDFIGETDVTSHVPLDRIVKFHKHEVLVYDEENEYITKPLVGQGLNKPAQVTLTLQFSLPLTQSSCVVDRLKLCTQKQGARFVSFDPISCEWKFIVDHFSRFGLSEDDEEDIVMMEEEQQPPDDVHVSDIRLMEQDQLLLSHSLPIHLGLDPAKMKEMRLLMFSAQNQEAQVSDGLPITSNFSSGKKYLRSYTQEQTRDMNRSSPPAVRRTPLPLLEYHPSGHQSTSNGTILMSQENKSLPLKSSSTKGFMLDLEHEMPVSGTLSGNVVDAGLFMGRSFRVGWGPNGILVHCGSPLGSTNQHSVLSSVINLEKVAFDRVARDETNKVREELVSSCFDSPLELHKALDHETRSIEVGDFQLKLLKAVSNPVMLPEICQSYVEIIEKNLEISRLSSHAQKLLIHQVMIWELIKVLFSERESDVEKHVELDGEEDMMYDAKEGSSEADVEALPCVRRAKFSFWLQESIHHNVEDDVSRLDVSNYLEQIFLLLTGRQLDKAVELAVSMGDVRLACLLSQAGASMSNRIYVSEQIILWRKNGLDFSLIENDRMRLYELLAGNVHGALGDKKVDWKRFLGLLMWYQLPPETPLPVIFSTYQNLLAVYKAPHPLPVYVDEGPVDETVTCSTTKHFDLAYYLMILHANGGSRFDFLKTMFSAFSSTNDPLDHHMIWHQRAVLEAVGAFSSNDLHALDMGLVSQLLCLGQCHWAIYVVLHMPYVPDYPYLHANLIREILFQNCDSWNSRHSQRQFIEDLGIPVEWMHEAMAVYHNYYGHSLEALENYLACKNWQKAHSVFMTSVAHTLYLSGEHSKMWKLVSIMEENKCEIESWELGAGIYVSYYHIKRFLEDNNSLNEQDSLENKNNACKMFFNCLHDSLALWGSRLPLDGRAAYLRMAEEICNLTLLESGRESATSEVLLASYSTVLSAPIPEDGRSCHLQEAISHFTCYLTERAS